MIFFMWVESLLTENFAERLRYFEVRKLYDIVWKGYELRGPRTSQDAHIIQSIEPLQQYNKREAT